MLTSTIRRLPSLLVAVGLLAACVPVTVNVNFPQEKIEGAAGDIEDMVRSPENPKPEPPPRKGPRGRLADGLLASLGPRQAVAQTQDVDVVPRIQTRTPELVKAIESRRARRPELNERKARGCIGETNQGLVELRPGPDCAGAAALVAAENADRTHIIETLMQQNNIPPSDGARVRAAFAKARRERAKPGEWVQEPGGQWVKK